MTFFKKNYPYHVFGGSFCNYCTMYKLRNCNSTVKPSNIQLRFWGYKKNAHSAKSLNLIEIMWKIIPNQVFAKISSGTHFFLYAKISNFSSKTRWFLRILTCNDYKLNIGPILHPQAPTWPSVTWPSPFLWI